MPLNQENLNSTFAFGKLRCFERENRHFFERTRGKKILERLGSERFFDKSNFPVDPSRSNIVFPTSVFNENLYYKRL